MANIKSVSVLDWADKKIHALLRTVFVLITVIAVMGFGQAKAANVVIDTTNANNGYVTVNYTSDKRLKVGIRYNSGRTSFIDCPNGTANFALEKGNGTYTVSLYQNVSGTKYQEIAKDTVTASMKDPLAPYKIATSEIAFIAGDAVCKKTDELCKNVKTEEAKVVAIWNYINNNYKYDYDFADKIKNKIIKQYTPNPNAILAKDKGICYDFASLFAAMCRHEGIPCTIVKGYVNTTYHAWNQIYVNGEWREVDLTRAVCQRASVARTIADCSAVVKERK